ncbi:MAG: hypothetical protein NVS3B16_09930 [Vulcanimicrobiaceae bacterium]
MNKTLIGTLAFGGSLLATAAIAFAYPGQQFASQANVTMAQAQATALRAVPGTIAAAELERENGGSGLRYSFDIKTSAGVREVGVDAKSGAVLENAMDGASPGNGESGESSEKTSESSEAGGD